MYAIIVYDVKDKRVTKICKFLRTSMNWVQNSVFEGEISEKDLEYIKGKIEAMINKDEDSVLIYKTISKRKIKRETLGTEKLSISNII